MPNGEPPDDDAASGGVLAGWLTRHQLSRQLGVSIDTLSRWGTQGIGPVHIRVGSRAYYRCDTVREWLISLERPKRSGR